MLSWYGYDVQLVMKWVIVILQERKRLYRVDMATMSGLWWGSDSSWLQVKLQERVYAELIWLRCPACDEVSDSYTAREKETIPSWYGHNVRLVMRWVIVHGYKLYCKRETIELIWPRCLACDEVSDRSWLQVILRERERLCRVDMAMMSGLWWDEW